ncbi:MAG: hypothetical protein GXX09_09310 [Syntrophomonadaceae bacterium]|nr:hypothetical protein [Syntrophomonadaceae bacterium]
MRCEDILPLTWETGQGYTIGRTDQPVGRKCVEGLLETGEAAVPVALGWPVRAGEDIA